MKEEKVILVSADTGEFDVEASLDELSELVETAGAEEIARVVQKRDAYCAATVIGEGKLAEVKELCEKLGANLLIFPEDPDTDPNSPGYKSGRPPTLFRGFPMLAQVYYSRTGKRCRFLPVLCYQKGRTVSFGTEIVYDPDNDPIAERDRIVDEAYRQMQSLYDREEAIANA